MRDSEESDAPAALLKILIAGGFGVGKTTLVGAVSQIEPLTTEEMLTRASIPHDSVQGVESKTSTTVALDFGMITLARQHMALLLFGTPGQERFWFMWPDLAKGAIGAVVLVDTRRFEECYPAVEYFLDIGLPIVVAVNHFDGADRYEPAEVHAALELPPGTPVVLCDARDRLQVRQTLITLVEHALILATRNTTPSPTPSTSWSTRV
ncbi:ATP/GTP-binding protein [Streptomyces sp. NBC_00028]|uniref:GTP-binding protein n=1 Tax=Streptomyces sp. NBC_00028 TaxID=2975624 RepID=UPI00324F7A0A